MSRRAAPEAIGRREFLVRGLRAAAAVGVWPFVPARAAAAEPRVLVVGAGLAGLTAAHRLAGAGWRPDLYEAQSRVGGRVRTIRGLAGGQIAEAGGQTINSNDEAIRALVAEVGLSLLDLNEVWPAGRTTYRFLGRNVPWSRIGPALREAGRVAYRHYRQLGWPVTYASPGARAMSWDRWTAAEWIDEFCPGGRGGVPGRYLEVLFEVDYAGPLQQMSAIHVIAELGGTFWGGGYDERYTIAGGNDVLPTRLAEALPSGIVKLDRSLEAVRRGVDGTLTCTFRTGASSTDVVADRVVLALPFSTLREVDLSGAGFRDRKVQAISGLGMGSNSKLHLQFGSEPWRPKTGESWTDLRLGTTWPEHPGQIGDAATVAIMNGAPYSTEFGSGPAHGEAPAEVTRRYLADLDRVFPGTSRAFLPGRAYLDAWPFDPWVRGSYSYYRTRGFTRFAGIEGEPEGNVHFAGEHTAEYRFRGTMNGAVASGERAAGEVLRAYGLSASAIVGV